MKFRQNERLKEILMEKEELIGIKLLRPISGEFIGFSENSICENRIIIPAKFRELFKPNAQKTVIVTMGPQDFIVIFPLDCWILMKEKRRTDPERGNKLITFLENMAMTPQVLEGPGRIRIREDLLRRAKITDKVIIQGNNHYMSLWNPEIFFASLDNQHLDCKTNYKQEDLALPVQSNDELQNQILS